MDTCFYFESQPEIHYERKSNLFPGILSMKSTKREKATCFQALEHEIQRWWWRSVSPMWESRNFEEEIENGTRYAVRDEVELKGALGVAAVVEL
jgi:hypothetical protein